MLALSCPPPRSLAAHHGRALLVGVSPSPFPPSSAACVRRMQPFRGPLSSVAPSAVSRSSRALLGVSSPPSSSCGCPCPVAPWPSLAGAGPALAGPPTNEAASFSYSRRWCASLLVVAIAVPVKCVGWYPAPLAPSSVSVYTSCLPVAPRRATLSPPLGGISLVCRAVGGFLSPPPRSCPSSPCWHWDAVGDPRVSTPLGPQSSLGVESSHDDSNPPPFAFGVESSYHDSTPPSPPLGVESS